MRGAINNGTWVSLLYVGRAGDHSPYRVVGHIFKSLMSKAAFLRKVTTRDKD